MLKVKGLQGQTLSLVSFRFGNDHVTALRELQSNAKAYVMAFTASGRFCLVRAADLNLSSLVPISELNPKWGA
jgi:hypothetical protein